MQHVRCANSIRNKLTRIDRCMTTWVAHSTLNNRRTGPKRLIDDVASVRPFSEEPVDDVASTADRITRPLFHKHTIEACTCTLNDGAALRC